jgi:hypothetical protein
MFKVLVGVGFIAFGVLLLAHALRRRRRWSFVSDAPTPHDLAPARWWKYFVVSERILEYPSERAVEKEGTVAEALAGALSVAVGIAAVIAFA